MFLRSQIQKGLCRFHRKLNVSDLVGYGTVQGESGMIRALNEYGPISFVFLGSNKFKQLKDEVLNFDSQCENNKGKLKFVYLSYC